MSNHGNTGQNTHKPGLRFCAYGRVVVYSVFIIGSFGQLDGTASPVNGDMC